MLGLNIEALLCNPCSHTFSGEYGYTKSGKRIKVKAKPDLKLKCGACGGKGHMRTNKACPKFVPDEFEDSLNVGLTEREEVT